ncbi:MAG TPA: pilus assembly protein TadG-related protein [Vicinamibacterales bacterium]|nr:pilus assembly protein TadG-related protein [Vicinamibacterales bacterium]
MRRTVTRYRDEAGMSLVFVALGFLGLFAATMLAIDVGMLMTARAQAQNSADAGALAGAVALAFDNYTDRSPSGPAVRSAIDAATTNRVMGGTVSVRSEDVDFLQNPDTGEWNRVRVRVHRTEERGNPVGTLIASIFGTDSADIRAVAVAEASPANAMTCVKPFTIPDKWIERTNPPWNPNSSEFEMYDKKGNLLPNPDIYYPATDKDRYTGYDAERDRGTRLMIRAGTGNNITPSFYFSLTIPGATGSTGADRYRWNIANCNTTVFTWGQLMIQEPGNMMGPTVQGAQELMAKDPTAYWDTAANCAKRSGSASCLARSPRIFPIPLYDPVYYETGKKQGRYADLKVANWIGFFLEDVVGNNIYGRITPIAGMLAGSGPVPEAAFPKVIRLIQ